MTKKSMQERMIELQKPLSPDDIELRVGHFMGTNGFCMLLAYKTARVDSERLDSVFPGAWGNDHHRDSKGILTATIRVWNDEINCWVERSDVGVESNTEKEKGEASDAFKRAGTKWGIGKELYELPPLKLTLRNNEWEQPKGADGKPITDKNGKAIIRQTFDLHLDEWRLVKTEDRGYVIYDEHGEERFVEKKTKTQKPTDDKPAKSVLDEDIEKAMKVAGIDNAGLIKLVKDNFQKLYKQLTTTEKQSVLNLIKKEAEK